MNDIEINNKNRENDHFYLEISAQYYFAFLTQNFSSKTSRFEKTVRYNFYHNSL